MEEKHEVKALALSEEKQERVYIGEEPKINIEQDIVDEVPRQNTNVYNTYVYNTSPARRINKLVALLLCIFLGYFGIHKFYEGKVGMGILYLFTGGLFGIGWIVDIVLIAMKPDPYYVGK